MRPSRVLPSAALAALFACSSIETDQGAAPATAEATSVHGIEIPDAPPMREPYTSYMKVKQGEAVVGYLVRYEPLPAYADMQQRYPAGTVFVEDRQFARLGFITPHGAGYRYEGTMSEPVGQGTVEYLLPRFFEGTGFALAPFDS
jgi:hypothetical protein